MVTVTKSRRVARRYAITKSEEACVEFGYPGPGGKRCSLTLIDISVSGLSFKVDGELLNIDSGTNLSPVVIRLGKCEIHGDLLVMHATPSSPNQRICGALFYPAKDADLLKLKSAIAGIEAVLED